MTKCRVCGALIKDDMQFCVKCTVDRVHAQALKKNPVMNSEPTSDADKIVCFVCGERLEAGSSKCGKCGTLKQDHAKILKWLLQAAKDGDDCIQQRLADMYFNGLGTDRDYHQALLWYLKSAAQGNGASKAQLGYMYEQNLGVDQDYQKALELYREAAKAGNALGQARLADMYYRGSGVEKDYKKAFAHFQEAAAQDNDFSRARLADMYFLGQGVKADLRRAFRLYRDSAERGNGHSQAQLGGMYFHGVEVERDYRKALEWYRPAVEQGNDVAQANLGFIYEKGLGVEKDFQKALKLYKKSAAQGNALGQARLGDLYLLGRGVEQDVQKAFQCFHKAAAQNNDLAQLRLGNMYCEGNGIEQDLAKGCEFYRQSAKQGNSAAQLVLGGMYRDGRGVQQDDKQAFAWVQKSAKKGNVVAQKDLGCLYEQGLGTDRDYRQARLWYLKAAAKDLAAAQVCLGNLYRDGLGVEASSAEAKKWYAKAAQKGNELALAELLKMELEADPEKKLQHRILASYKGDAKAMAEVAQMYLAGTGVEKNEAIALEWLKKAFDFGNVSVRGQLLELQQSLAARREEENETPAITEQKTVPLPIGQKSKAPAARSLFFLFSAIVTAGLLLAIISSGFNKKSGGADEQSPPRIREIAASPRPAIQAEVPAISETMPEAIEAIVVRPAAPRQSEKTPPAKTAADLAVIKTGPVAASLRREYKSLDEQEISRMLAARNIFDAARNPDGNFRHQFETGNSAGVNLIFDRATGLVWMRQQNPVRMNLQKAKDWTGSLNNIGYGGIRSWRLPTVEEAASLLQKNQSDGKLFLDAVFGKDITAAWTGDGFTDSRSWFIDFRNGLVDYAKNRNRLPLLMVSSD